MIHRKHKYPSALTSSNVRRKDKEKGSDSKKLGQLPSIEAWDQWMVNHNFPPMPNSAKAILSKWGGRFFYLRIGSLYIDPSRASDGECGYFEEASTVLGTPIYPIAEYEMNIIVVSKEGKVFAIFAMDEIYEFRDFESFLHAEVSFTEWKQVDLSSIESKRQ